MPLQISRLRRWFAIAAIAITLLVAGAYFYARHRLQNALKEVPGKMGINIQQSAEGFTVSKSEAGRTLFKLQASKAVQFRQGGRTELHDVNIILYGRDSSRFDQIYGSDFEYDPRSGDVLAKGDVQIDLEANPAGLTAPDQAAPKELKNPIHLRTRGLVFNQKSGNAYTKEKVEFSIPQASGSALGVSYTSKSNALTLESQVQVQFTGPNPAVVHATHGLITKEPRQVVLQQARMEHGSQKVSAEQATLFLRPDNTMDHLLATGNVQADGEGASAMHARADRMEMQLSGGPQEVLRSAVLTGNVQMESTGAQPMHGSAGRVVMAFAGKNLLKNVRAEDGVRLVEPQKPGQNVTAKAGGGQAATGGAGVAQGAQDIIVTAPVMNFVVAAGRRLERADTSGAAQIAIQPAAGSQGQTTLVTAGRFEASFDGRSHLTGLHGSPGARIVNSGPGQPERVSTSRELFVKFKAAGGLEEIEQRGSVAYDDHERKAWSDQARFTPADQMLVMTGSPRVADAGMTTTAQTMRLDRSTGDAFAEGDVKSTYSELKQQPDGAFLASTAPIHVTSRTMSARKTAGIALYTGEARLWQEANVIQAPSILFDRQRRSVTAEAGEGKKVSTVLVQRDKKGSATPIVVTSGRLTYVDQERKAHLEGGVTAHGADATITSDSADVYLLAQGQAPQNKTFGSPSSLDRMVASGHVAVNQPGRRAEGNELVYSAGDDKFVLTGGPPSIFDAEHGKITGVSLTFFRRDDRVLVEGTDTSPTVTHTRVAR